MPEQRALETEAEKRNDDNEDYSGPDVDTNSSRESGEEDSDGFVEEIPAPAGNPKANDGSARGLGAATARALAQGQGAVPAPNKRKLLLVPQTAVRSRLRGEPR